MDAGVLTAGQDTHPRTDGEISGRRTYVRTQRIDNPLQDYCMLRVYMHCRDWVMVHTFQRRNRLFFNGSLIFLN